MDDEVDEDRETTSTSPSMSSTSSYKIQNGDNKDDNGVVDNNVMRQSSNIATLCRQKPGNKKVANEVSVEVAATTVPDKFFSNSVVEDPAIFTSGSRINNSTTSVAADLSYTIGTIAGAVAKASATTSSKAAENATDKGQCSAPVSTASLPAEPQPTTDSISVGPLDVLFGRGVPIQRHMGNRRMHNIVRSYRQRYRHASRADKTLLVRATIRDIRQGGTRFLKRVEGKDHVAKWREVAEDAIYEKISHALRGNGSAPRKDSPKKRKSTDAPHAARTRSRSEDDGPCPPTNAKSVNFPASFASSPEIGISTSMPTTQPQWSYQNFVPTPTLAAAQIPLAAQLLQIQLISQRLQLPLQGSTSSVTAELARLFGSNNNNQQQLPVEVGSTTMTSHPLMGHCQQQQQLTIEDSSTQLLNQLLLSAENPGALACAVSQLVQERQQQQARVQLLRQVEQELAIRRLVAGTSQGSGGTRSQAQEQYQHHPPLNPNALLLSLLLGNFNNGPSTSPATSNLGLAPHEK